MKLWFTIVALSLLIACGDGKKTAGGNTTETGNSIQAMVMLPNGKPAAQARMILRTKEDSDSILATALADQNGSIDLVLPDDSNWVLEAASSDGSLLGMIVSKVDTVHLKTPAELHGQVIARNQQGYAVHLVGLGRDVVCNSAGQFKLDSIPAGLINMAVRKVDGSEQALYSQRIEAKSGIDMNVGLVPAPDDAISLQRITLRIPAGILDSTIYAYPLLLRLDHFANDSLTVIYQGQKLAWERDGAALWVRMDSIVAQTKDDSLALTLLWGLGSDGDVFRSAEGWLSVLHLGDSLSVVGPNLELKPLLDSGIAGTAAVFDGLASGSGAEIPMLDSVGPTQALYISGWVRPDLAIGTEQAPWTAESNGKSWILLGNTQGGWTWRVEQDGSAESILPGVAEVGQWSYLAMWVDPVANTLGVSENGELPILQASTGVLDEYIRPSIGYGFIGALDEIRIRSHIPTQSERRLDYWIQKPSSQAIQIE